MADRMPLTPVLMVAFHFPPLAGSSGVQRTLRFVQHLPALGWRPLALSASPRAYERVSEDLLADIPDCAVVRRAFALDAARHLAVAGHYFGWTAKPDRWVSWRFDAVRHGMQLVREFRPRVIWSTYPIATAHLIASAIHKKTGLPWVADFRDPMAQDGYPADPAVWAMFKRIEEDAAQSARFCVFTTPGAARVYRDRYPAAAERIVVLENGYDECSFSGLPPPASVPVATRRRLLLLHSGIVYPSERDPAQLFAALRGLRDAAMLDPADLLIRFRAAAHDEMLKALAARYGVGDFIEFSPATPYRAALAEMQAADALLVLQAGNCNDQIPAKVYEYLRAGRPIIALTDPAGDTAGVLRQAGISAMARLDSAQDIERALPVFLAAVRTGTAATAAPAAVRAASRMGRSAVLAGLLEQAAKG